MRVQRSTVALVILVVVLLTAVVACASAPGQTSAVCTRAKPQPAERFERTVADRIVIGAKPSIFAIPASTNIYADSDKRVILDNHPLPCNFYVRVSDSVPVNGMIHVAELVRATDGEVYGMWTRSGWIEDTHLSPIYDFGTYVARWTGPAQ